MKTCCNCEKYKECKVICSEVENSLKFKKRYNSGIYSQCTIDRKEYKSIDDSLIPFYEQKKYVDRYNTKYSKSIRLLGLIGKKKHKKVLDFILSGNTLKEIANMMKYNNFQTVSRHKYTGIKHLLKYHRTIKNKEFLEIKENPIFTSKYILLKKILFQIGLNQYEYNSIIHFVCEDINKKYIDKFYYFNFKQKDISKALNIKQQQINREYTSLKKAVLQSIENYINNLN